jgi:hypothetical protein
VGAAHASNSQTPVKRPSSALPLRQRVAGVGASGRLSAQLGRRPRTSYGIYSLSGHPELPVDALDAPSQGSSFWDEAASVSHSGSFGSLSEQSALTAYLKERDSKLSPPTQTTDANYWYAMMMGDNVKTAGRGVRGLGRKQNPDLPSFTEWETERRHSAQQSRMEASATKVSMQLAGSRVA